MAHPQYPQTQASMGEESIRPFIEEVTNMEPSDGNCPSGNVDSSSDSDFTMESHVSMSPDYFGIHETLRLEPLEPLMEQILSGLKRSQVLLVTLESEPGIMYSIPKNLVHRLNCGYLIGRGPEPIRLPFAHDVDGGTFSALILFIILNNVSGRITYGRSIWTDLDNCNHRMLKEALRIAMKIEGVAQAYNISISSAGLEVMADQLREKFEYQEYYAFPEENRECQTLDSSHIRQAYMLPEDSMFRELVVDVAAQQYLMSLEQSSPYHYDAEMKHVPGFSRDVRKAAGEYQPNGVTCPHSLFGPMLAHRAITIPPRAGYEMLCKGCAEYAKRCGHTSTAMYQAER